MYRVFQQLIHRYFSDEEAVILLMVIVGVMLTLYWFGQTLTPAIASLIIAYIFAPLVEKMVKVKVPYLLAVFIVFLIFVSILLVALFGLMPLLVGQTTNLVAEVPRMFFELQQQILVLPDKFPDVISNEMAQQWVGYLNSSEMNQQFAGVAGQIVSISLSTLPGFLSLAVYLVIVPVLVFFMLKDRDELWNQLLSLLPRRRRLMNEIAEEMNQQIANYIRGKVIEILIVGAVAFVVFSFLGLQYKELLALLVGLSVLIPYIGAIVVTVPIAVIAMFQFGISNEFWMVLGAYTVIQALDGNVLVPILFSEAVNLSPTAIIIAVLFFGGIWGFWGVFFAIPLATLLKAIYNAWPKHYEELEEPEETEHFEG